MQIRFGLKHGVLYKLLICLYQEVLSGSTEHGECHSDIRRPITRPHAHGQCCENRCLLGAPGSALQSALSSAEVSLHEKEISNLLSLRLFSLLEQPKKTLQ